MNILELHYYLENNSHSMNAIAKNRSETELIKLFNEVAHLLDFEIELEFEALKEGGIKEIVKYFGKKQNRRRLKNILIYFSAIFSGVVINVASDIINKDKELDNLSKEEKRLNIRKLKNYLEQDSISKQQEEEAIKKIVLIIVDTYKVQVFKSRFYQQILKDTKVLQFSVTELDSNYKPLSVEKSIIRESFSKQILENDDMAPEIIDDANIEIISPVLKQGNLKWRGFYNGSPINFHLLDSGFKDDVLNRKYSFSNGTSIRCRLEIVISIDNGGEEIIKDAKVLDVLEVFDNGQTIVTKKAKHLSELKTQMKIDFKE